LILTSCQEIVTPENVYKKTPFLLQESERKKKYEWILTGLGRMVQG